jgi:hypothetical protein
LLPVLWFHNRHGRSGVFGDLPPRPGLWPWPGGWLDALLPVLWRGGRHGRSGAGVLGGLRTGQGLRLPSRYRGDGEGPGDVRGHLAQLSRQPDGARPQLVGLPCRRLTYRVGLVLRLPLYLLGLPLGFACRVDLVGRLPPDLVGFPLGGFTYRVGLVQRLLPDPGSLAVGIREDPLRQPDGVRVLESPGILLHGVMQLCRMFAGEMRHLPGAGVRRPLLASGGQQDLDRAVAERDLVIRRWRRVCGVLA